MRSITIQGIDAEDTIEIKLCYQPRNNTFEVTETTSFKDDQIKKTSEFLTSFEVYADAKDYVIKKRNALVLLGWRQSSDVVGEAAIFEDYN